MLSIKSPCARLLVPSRQRLAPERSHGRRRFPPCCAALNNPGLSNRHQPTAARQHGASPEHNTTDLLLAPTLTSTATTALSSALAWACWPAEVAARTVCINVPDAVADFDLWELLQSPWFVLGLALVALSLLPRIIRVRGEPQCPRRCRVALVMAD